MPVVTDEAVQDFQALFTNMTHAQMKEFILESITAAGATSLSVTKEVRQNEDKTFREVFVLKFNQ